MEDFSEQQLLFMRKAIEIGEKGRSSAPPNPWVGCVLVKEGRVIGEGFHNKKGALHAEAIAIHSARESVEGSELFVTLEPCCHYGNTPPCVDLLIKNHIAAIYVALLDPDQRVTGRGIERLRKAGIPTYLGIGENEARESLRPYLHQRTTGMPWVILKSAMTLDGQVADCQEHSQWITCLAAREDVGQLRAQSQAVVVGARTVLIDDPSLTARAGCGALLDRQPLRVVIDRSGRVSPNARLFALPNALYVTSSQCPEEHVQSFRNAGIRVLVTPPESRSCLEMLLRYLAELECLQVLVEGGSQLHTAFLKENLAHSLVIYVGAKILGNQCRPLYGNLGRDLASALHGRFRSAILLGESLKIIYEI